MSKMLLGRDDSVNKFHKFLNVYLIEEIASISQKLAMSSNSTNGLAYPDFDIHEGPSSGAVFMNVIIVVLVFVIFTASFIAALCYFSPKEIVDEKAIELEKRRSTYMQRVASERTRSAMA